MREGDAATSLSGTYPRGPFGRSEIQDVRIMSLHKSKGLSAPVTIIAGCVEGLLPQQPEHILAAYLGAQKLWTCSTPTRSCLYRKLDSTVMVMKSAEHRHRCDAAYVLESGW